MRALLLAAGLGTRLRPLTDTVPKCLVPIAGRPLLDIWLDLVFQGGCERALVNLHHHAEVVERHLRSSPWRDRVDTVREPVLLGTGGTVLANRGWFADAPFVVAHADNLSDADIGSLADRHARRPAGIDMTMLAFRTDRPSTCGILELAGRDAGSGDQAAPPRECGEPAEGRVVAFHEKVAEPPGNLANGALYILQPEVVDAIAALGKPVVDLSTEVIPAFLGRILAVEHSGYHRDIGTLDSLNLAQAHVAAGLVSVFPGSSRPPLAVSRGPRPVAAVSSSS